MRRLFVLVSLIFFSANSYGSDFSACANISSDIERLACFDRIVKVLGITVNKKTEARETNAKSDNSNDGKLPKWKSSESSSEMDDSSTVTLTLDAENTVKGFLTDSYTPILLIRCKENKTDMILNTQSQFDSSGLYDAKAKVRIGKGKAITQSFSLATNRQAIFFKRPIGKIKKMFGEDIMKIQWTPFNANPVVATFEINGLKEEITLLRKTCNW